jgi:hypothetical protein
MDEASLLLSDDDELLLPEPQAVRAVAARAAAAAAVSSLALARVCDTMDVLSVRGTKAAGDVLVAQPLHVPQPLFPTECREPHR